MSKPLQSEPVLILAACAALAQVVVGFVSHHPDPLLISAAITAVTAAVTRGKVYAPDTVDQATQGLEQKGGI